MNTNQLHQMQLRYIPIQDRLLFRLNTLERQEYQLWFTRRYTKLLWRALMNLLEELQDEGEVFNAQARAAKVSFQHEQAVSEADFAKPYEHGLHQPLGTEPVLLARIRIKARAGGGHILCLHPEEGRGVELAIDVSLLHSLLQLITDAVDNTGWDLALQLGSTVEMMMEEQPRVVN
jgi:hypothetical protein